MEIIDNILLAQLKLMENKNHNYHNNDKRVNLINDIKNNTLSPIKITEKSYKNNNNNMNSMNLRESKKYFNLIPPELIKNLSNIKLKALQLGEKFIPIPFKDDRYYIIEENLKSFRAFYRSARLMDLHIGDTEEEKAANLRRMKCNNPSYEPPKFNKNLENYIKEQERLVTISNNLIKKY